MLWCACVEIKAECLFLLLLLPAEVKEVSRLLFLSRYCIEVEKVIFWLSCGRLLLRL